MPELKVTSQHLQRDAYLYIRQSTPRQVLTDKLLKSVPTGRLGAGLAKVAVKYVDAFERPSQRSPWTSPCRSHRFGRRNQR